VLWVADRFKTR